MVDENVNENPSIGIKEPPTKFRSILTKIGLRFDYCRVHRWLRRINRYNKYRRKPGFTLLWLIIIGCIIKVFVQVELGRFTLVNGITSIRGLNMLPGPRVEGKGNWFIWYWFVMFAFIMGQLGGIVGGVGQAMSISIPLTQEGQEFNEYREAETLLTVLRAQYSLMQNDWRKQLNCKIWQVRFSPTKLPLRNL